MHRRTFLATLASATLAGCSTFADGSTPTQSDAPTRDTPSAEPRSPTGTREPSPRSSTPDDGFPEWDGSVVDLETVNRTYALAPASYRTADEGAVRMRFTATATPEHPATVEAVLENTNDFANTFRVERIPPFGDPTSRFPDPFGPPSSGPYTYREELVFAPTPDHEHANAVPDVTRYADGTWRVADVSPWQPETIHLDPGESIRGEYYLVGRADGVESGRPTGTYEFTGRHDDGFRVAVWNTDAPGPGEPSRFESVSLPAFSSGRDSNSEADTAWYHEADRTTGAYVRPSVERARLPARIEFTFVNKTRESVGCGHWDLFKLVDGEWFHVAPYFHTSDCRVLWPGAEKIWTLNAYHGEALPAIGGGRSGRAMGYLGGGRYAVVTGYAREASRSGALLDLVGDEVAVVPTDDVKSDRDGDTVRVTSPKPEREDRAPARLILTRADDGGTRIIPEQVMRERYRGLRNVLAFLEEGVERVVLETGEYVAERVVGHDERSRLIAFDGRSYEVRIERSDAE